MTFTREPSGSRASTSGSASSTRRPSGARMRSIACRRSASVSNATPASSIRPARSTNTEPGPLTMTSSTVGSRSSGSSAPRPKDRSMTRPTRSSRVSGSSTPASRSTSARMRAWRSPSSPAPASRTSRSRRAAARPSSSSLTRPVGRRGAMFAPERASPLEARVAVEIRPGSVRARDQVARRLRASRHRPRSASGVLDGPTSGRSDARGRSSASRVVAGLNGSTDRPVVTTGTWGPRRRSGRRQLRPACRPGSAVERLTVSERCSAARRAPRCSGSRRSPGRRCRRSCRRRRSPGRASPRPLSYGVPPTLLGVHRPSSTRAPSGR